MHGILLSMKPLCALLREEPYRLFFPAGMLAGIWGVMMWPMLYGGLITFYPGEAHTRMMIEGFMGAFVIGFIGTAFPRLSGSRIWHHGEWLALVVLWLLTVVSHASGHVTAGDAAFCGLLGVLLTGMLARLLFGRKDTPPPGFILVLPTLIGAMAAAWLLSRPGLNPIQIQWAKLWLYQAFPLLPIMGIAPYLLPRFFGHDSSHSFDDSPTPPAGWWPKAIKSLIAGTLIVISFAIEVAGHSMAAHLLRAATVIVWIALETPILKRAKQATTPGNAARIALLSIAAGWIAVCIWPNARVGALHLFFSSGIALITLAVSTRVILGHAGRHDLLAGKIVWLRWIIAILILASTTRLSAELLPKVQVSHHIYAAWSWAIGGMLWLIMIAKYLWQHEGSKKPSKCPRRRGAH